MYYVDILSQGDPERRVETQAPTVWPWPLTGPTLIDVVPLVVYDGSP